MRPAQPGRQLAVETLAGSALLQDLGRDGLVASGVPSGGAFDRRAHRLALDLVGCPSAEATVELVGAITLRASGDLLVAVTGRAMVELSSMGGGLDGDVDWQPAPSWTALDLGSGERLRIRTQGRAYLAVRGGLLGATVLGSRSTCLLGPLGPAPLRTGDRLDVGEGVALDARAGDFCRAQDRAGPHLVVTGPHDRFDRVRATVVDASRIGLRIALEDPASPLPSRADLPSLGVLPGTIQALPTGDWMVLGPDAGTMGGYPVVGVLAGDVLDRWAHLRSGDSVTLRAVTPGSFAAPPLESVVRVGEIG